jgi:hypothetical protein
MHRRRSLNSSRLRFAPSAEWLTTQVCAIAILCLVAGLIAGAIGAVAYALVKGLNL